MPRLGVFYFPGWKAGSPSLSSSQPWDAIKRYPEREPLLGWYEEGRLPVMEQHLEWMANYGLKFVVFDWYWGGGRSLNDHALKAYVQSKGKSRVSYAVMWANHEEKPLATGEVIAMVDDLIKNHFERPEYLKAGGKPVLFVMVPGKLNDSAIQGGSSHRELSDRIDAAAKNAGLPGVFLVGGANGGVNDVTRHGQQWGYDAFFIYNYSSGPGGMDGQQRDAHSYAELDMAYRQQWRWFMSSSALPYVVPMTAGWDMRPWGGSSDRLRDQASSTPEEFARHLQAARTVIDRNPQKTLGLGVICCWNEFGEGSYIEPTKRLGLKYLEAVQSIFGSP